MVSTIRSDLILWMLLSNGSRSGAILNAVVDEFNSATPKDNEWIMSVRHHKTYATYGPCHLVLSEDLYH